MSRGIRLGSKAGYPIIKAPEISELTSITLTPSLSAQTITAPADMGYNEVTVNPVTAEIDENIISENIKPGISILEVEGTCELEDAFYIKKELSSDGILLNCSDISTIQINDISANTLAYAFYKNTAIKNITLNIENISSNEALAYAFQESSVVNVNFVNLKTITTDGLMRCFYGCKSLQTVQFSALSEITKNGLSFPVYPFMHCSNVDIYFPALKSSSFISSEGFYGMLSFAENITLHFPSNLNTIIPTLNSYPTFGGGDTVLLYDLPATE